MIEINNSMVLDINQNYDRLGKESFTSIFSKRRKKLKNLFNSGIEGMSD